MSVSALTNPSKFPISRRTSLVLEVVTPIPDHFSNTLQVVQGDFHVMNYSSCCRNELRILWCYRVALKKGGKNIKNFKKLLLDKSACPRNNGTVAPGVPCVCSARKSETGCKIVGMEEG